MARIPVARRRRSTDQKSNRRPCGERKVVRRLSGDAKAGGILEVELADVVLREHAQRDAAAEREVRADPDIPREVRRLCRQSIDSLMSYRIAPTPAWTKGAIGIAPPRDEPKLYSSPAS